MLAGRKKRKAVVRTESPGTQEYESYQQGSIFWDVAVVMVEESGELYGLVRRDLLRLK